MNKMTMACGCTIPAVAGARRMANSKIQLDKQNQGLTPICRGRINDIEVDVMRDRLVAQRPV